MPVFSDASRARLLTCDSRLVSVLSEAIRYVDFAVVSGHRTPEEQHSAYISGHSTLRGLDPAGRPLYLSKHTLTPSLAVDVAPWAHGRILWEDHQAFYVLAGGILYAAAQLGISIAWGGHWTRPDLPHFEVDPHP